ncbi:hypothetical protein VTL71DRAFT_1426 [Oculimacula yallundae]|uniref:Uncharacterized protein n=1 Tax=Oculimacula yallundae TaxID=86028 RepID=A0ABR4CBG1_9HELO
MVQDVSGPLVLKRTRAPTYSDRISVSWVRRLRTGTGSLVAIYGYPEDLWNSVGRASGVRGRVELVARLLLSRDEWHMCWPLLAYIQTIMVVVFLPSTFLIIRPSIHPLIPIKPIVSSKSFRVLVPMFLCSHYHLSTCVQRRTL